MLLRFLTPDTRYIQIMLQVKCHVLSRNEAWLPWADNEFETTQNVANLLVHRLSFLLNFLWWFHWMWSFLHMCQTRRLPGRTSVRYSCILTVDCHLFVSGLAIWQRAPEACVDGFCVLHYGTVPVVEPMFEFRVDLVHPQSENAALWFNLVLRWSIEWNWTLCTSYVHLIWKIY